MQQTFDFTLSARRIVPRMVRLLLTFLVVCASVFAALPAQAQSRTHEVKRGESLALIAGQYNISLNKLMTLNGIADANLIYIGQKLLLPSDGAIGIYGTPVESAELPGDDGYYLVRRGDSLSQVAKDYGMTLGDLMRLNGIEDASLIYIGQQLRVTARVEVAAPESAAAAPEEASTLYVVKPGDTLASIAKQFDSSIQALMVANGLPNVNFIWVGQQLRISDHKVTPEKSLTVAGAPEDGLRWIEINLSKQTLTAWQGDMVVMHTEISSGREPFITVTGRYPVYTKYASQRMTGPGYDIPGVPWVMYFFSGYAIHGAYWHTNFGTPASHGCINMRPEEAELLYHWASIGTEVYVHY